MKSVAVLLCILMCFSCDEIPVPKPKAFLSLDYPKAAYHKSLLELPFEFEKNKLAQINISKKNNRIEGVVLRYPNLKASVFINYKKVDNNLEKYISDARARTQKHLQMADEISERMYENDSQKLYGMFYDLKGNVASQSQFYVTDSTRHFISGVLYFETKPNYDSILPAINYIQKDMMHLIESLRWK
ncbi:gliding motility lipoprotein GldD [Flavobacteriaceae bacterium]|nr:gliding motility lipoprotein GldD [Flavobacteriaceae bacterium]